MEEVVKRNFKTLADGLNAQRGHSSDQDKKIEKLESEVLELRSAISDLRIQLMQVTAMYRGTGPTAR